MWRETRGDRRATAAVVLALCAATAATAFATALSLGRMGWLAWLLPSARAGNGGAVFVRFDLRNAARADAAEIAGAAAFALLPATITALAGAPVAAAGALATVMGGRSVPTVLAVRAALRAAKAGMMRRGPAVGSAGLALAAGVGLWRAGLAPSPRPWRWRSSPRAPLRCSSQVGRCGRKPSG